MAIYYPPIAGSVVICDFSGFKSPEMVKQRPVVVISPKHQARAELCTIVPLSTTPPNIVQPYHHEFRENPIPGRTEQTWAKCDMLATVATNRLDRVKISRGRYEIPRIAHDDLDAIRACIRHFLSL